MPVDGYAHCGKEKYLPVEALDTVMDEAGVEAAVLCQHLGQFDNSYIGTLVRARPGRFAGVALVDHRSPAWREALAETGGEFRGVRITSDAVRECPALVHTAAAAGRTLVVYAPEGVGAIAGDLVAAAATHPDTAVVLSHLGNPLVEDRELRHGREVLGFADLPNVFVLLSGLAMFCPFPFSALDGLIAEIVAAFGPDRVMWGSNFPVGGDGVTDYRCELELVASGGRWGIGADAVAAITDTTARRVWFR